ncbi:MAG TPA: hypothetical protein PLC38_03055 [Methanobacterium sp.]|nr:MAG: hypothetical protein FGO69_09825 [Methanobacterium sp.]HOI71247.1 hypothetical protein [Methanobacterium sp.]
MNTRCVSHNLRHNLPQEDIDKAYDIVERLFSKSWLNQDNDHPLQTLWRRKDDLAMIEIYSFGNALLTIDNKDPKWVKEKIKRMKFNDVGAIFEILASAMFVKGENHEVIFPSGDNSFDLIVKFKDNSEMNVELKNYRKSRFNQIFDDKAKNFEQRFKNFCRCLKIPSIQCLIFTDKYPVKPDWLNLNYYISHLLLYAIDDGISNKWTSYKFDNWVFMIGNTGEYENYISDFRTSYNLLISVPFHENYLKNLTESIKDKAISKFSNPEIKQDTNKINIVYVNINGDYSLDELENWAKEYFKDNKPNIAGIYFQKGYIDFSLRNRFEIVYVYRLVKNDFFYDIWSSGNEQRILNLISPMNNFSKHTDKEAKHVLAFEKDGKLEEVDYSNGYNYHYGELFLKNYKNLQNKIGSPGLRRYLVKKIENGYEIHFCNTPREQNFILL